MKLAGIICLVMDHKYTQERRYTKDEAQFSVCTRCGHKRCRPPGESDLLGPGGGWGVVF